MIEALDRRHEQYNETLALLKKLEQDGTALVLAQTETVPIGRFEKKPEKLARLYNVGLRDGEAILPKLKNW